MTSVHCPRCPHEREDGDNGQLGVNVQEHVEPVLNSGVVNVTTQGQHMEVIPVSVIVRNTDFVVLVRESKLEF